MLQTIFIHSVLGYLQKKLVFMHKGWADDSLMV